jgi:prepilin-type N-terminal cleavage/methylation domain-containing protein
MFRVPGKPSEGGVVGAAASGDRSEHASLERKTWNLKHPASQGFTLIELITVIGIMAVMMVIAIPSMNASRASAVSAGANEITSTMMFARAKAITQRSQVRVVFWNGLYTTNNIIPNVSYAILLLNAGSWEYVTNWRHLPKGAYFSTLPGALPSPFPFPVGGFNIANIPSVQFRSTGALISGDISIAVSEGTALADGSVVNKKPANTLTNQVFSMTGRSKVLR